MRRRIYFPQHSCSKYSASARLRYLRFVISLVVACWCFRYAHFTYRNPIIKKKKTNRIGCVITNSCIVIYMSFYLSSLIYFFASGPSADDFFCVIRSSIENEINDKFIAKPREKVCFFVKVAR